VLRTKKKIYVSPNLDGNLSATNTRHEMMRISIYTRQRNGKKNNAFRASLVNVKIMFRSGPGTHLKPEMYLFCGAFE